MSVSDLVRTRADVPLVSNPEAMLARYKQLRHVSRCLNDKFVKRLSKDVIREGTGSSVSCKETRWFSIPKTNLRS